MARNEGGDGGSAFETIGIVLSALLAGWNVVATRRGGVE